MAPAPALAGADQDRSISVVPSAVAVRAVGTPGTAVCACALRHRRQGKERGEGREQDSRQAAHHE